MRQLVLDLAPPPAPTLENFTPGRNTELLHALRAWLGASSHPSIYLWGPRGCGKTHLLRAATQAARAQGNQAVCLTAIELAASKPQALPTYVALDDVDAADAQAQSALFTLLDRAAQGGSKLLAAGPVAPAGLSLREDVRTRLGAALVLQVQALSDAEKAAALQAHARSRSFELPAEAADYLLRHGPRDLPWLMSVLDALDRHSLQTQRAITLPLLREVLGRDLQRPS